MKVLLGYNMKTVRFKREIKLARSFFLGETELTNFHLVEKGEGISPPNPNYGKSSVRKFRFIFESVNLQSQ